MVGKHLLSSYRFHARLTIVDALNSYVRVSDDVPKGVEERWSSKGTNIAEFGSAPGEDNGHRLARAAKVVADNIEVVSFVDIRSWRWQG